MNIVLIAAAYNAGKHNVNKWIRVFGDPRTNAISMMSWIELIPFRETRCYVQRVIEAFSVYTCILKVEYLQNVVWSLF
jgi:soluble lytic murein transglycosylase